MNPSSDFRAIAANRKPILEGSAGRALPLPGSNRTRGVICLICAAITVSASIAKAEITQQHFGTTKDRKEVQLFKLKNKNGCEARITNYGGTVISLTVPDRNGKFADVVLGFDSFQDNVTLNNAYIGTLMGRYANRIAKGRFTLDGKEYQLPINNPPNHLHGGVRGFNKRVWDARALETPKGPAVELKYLSPDGEEGYPGNLSVTARYTLTDRNELRVDFTAKTDKTTILNLTQHCYFNLAGQGEGDILGHIVQINATRFLPVDENLIPTGELRPVHGTPFDFQKPTAIGARIEEKNEQLIRGNGYDHTFVINKGILGGLRRAARVVEPKSGRVMEMLTTQPGMQFYTGNFLDGMKGKGGKVYKRRYGFCTEGQHFPDSPNHPKFPSTVLKPGETFRCTIIYRFSTE